MVSTWKPSRGRLAAALAIVSIAFAVVAAACGQSLSDGGQQSESSEIIVSAASDLGPVLDEMAPLFEKETGVALSTNLGSTGQLMEQIAAGAKVDVFLAASSSAIDQLDEKGLLVPDSKRLYARGQLVMWTAPDSKVTVSRLEDLAGAGVTRVSIANPEHAPYGKAAKEALESTGLWDQLQPKLVPGENVRQAFQYAQSGNVDVGLVAFSLTVGQGGTYTVVPEELHQPINQTLALIKAGQNQSAARRFVDFLTGPKGSEMLLKYGFVLPEE